MSRYSVPFFTKLLYKYNPKGHGENLHSILKTMLHFLKTKNCRIAMLLVY